MSALERLPKEFVMGTKCLTCLVWGACRDWVLSAAQDAQCDAEWLAEQVLAGRVDADTSVVRIKELWKEIET